MNKYLYLIKKMKILPWIKYYLINKGSKELVSLISQTLPLTLNNTLELKFEKFQPEGETEQDGTPTPETPVEIKNVEGKNILDITKSEQGGIDANGNLVSGTSLWRANTFIDVKPNTQYTLSRNEKIISSENILIRVYQYDKDKNFITPRSESSTKTLTINTTSNTKYLKWTIYRLEGINQEDINSLDLMLEEGSVATPYVPYNSIEFKVENKNLAKQEFDQKLRIVVSGSDRILQATTYNDGQIVPCKPSTTYVIDGDFSVFPDGNCRVRAFDNYPTLGIIDANTAFSNGSSRFTITTDATSNYLFIYTTGDNKNINVQNMFVCEQQYADTYIAHQEQISYFTFEEGQYLAEGGYLADDGIHNILKETEVNISYIVTLSNGNIGGVFFPSNKIRKNNNYLKSTKAIFDKTRTYAENTVYENAGNIVFCGNSEDTLATMKEKFNDSILQYELANPQPTPYTPTQATQWNAIKELYGYNEQTNISCTGSEVMPKLSIDYWKEII